MNTILLIITTLFSGLIAGLFYAWSISVTPGLARVGDTHYLHAFQSMNRAILNPAFFVAFMGLVILLPLLAYFYFKSPISAPFWYILSAMLLYLIGVILVTFLGNIPLNNNLEALFIESMTPAQMDVFRLEFEHQWNRFNYIRTLSSTLSFILLILACLQNTIH